MQTDANNRGPGFAVTTREESTYYEPDNACAGCGRRCHHGFTYCTRCGGARPFVKVRRRDLEDETRKD